MKTIADIYEKLKVDDITFDKFPINGTLEETIEFLKCNGFNNVIHHGGGAVDMFNEYKSKCFYKKEDHFWFADTSKENISKKNPIFYISHISEIFDVYYRDSSSWIIDIVKDDKKAFLKELNKRFGWE